MTNKRFFARTIAVVLTMGLILTCCFMLFACNKDKDEPKSIADIYKSKTSESEFSSYKLEFMLEDGWSVYTTSTSKNSQAVDVNSDVGYIESINAFIVQKDGFLSVVKCSDDKVRFDGAMKGQLFPLYSGATAIRVKSGLIACKFANGEAGVFDSNGNTVLSRAHFNTVGESAGIDEMLKILDSGLIAVNAKYDNHGVTGYTSIYRPTTSGDVAQRGNLICRVENDDEKLTYVRGFDGKYVTVVGNSEGSFIFLIPQNPTGQNLSATTNGTVEDNGNDDYYSEITYMGDGKFFIHEDWTVESTADYMYYDGFDYYVFQRRVYTPDNDYSYAYTDNADKVFLYLENSYYGGDKGGIDTSSYLKDGFTYASYGLTIIGKVGTYDQYILDSDLNIVMSLTGNYGITIKDQKKEKVGFFDLVMLGVDGYYYNPIQPSEFNIYDADGNIVGHNDRNSVTQQELTNNIVVAAMKDPDDDSEYLFGAFNLYGDTIIPFEYSSLSAFRGSYTIGRKYNTDEKKTENFIIGSDGKIVTEMSDGSTPLADIAISTSKQPIYKIGCYMFKVDSGQKNDNGEIIYNYGIKNFNPNVNKNVVMPATMKAGSVLYASSYSPQNVFVFEKIEIGTSVTYTVYRLI